MGRKVNKFFSHGQLRIPQFLKDGFTLTLVIFNKII